MALPVNSDHHHARTSVTQFLNRVAFTGFFVLSFEIFKISVDGFIMFCHDGQGKNGGLGVLYQK